MDTSLDHHVYCTGGFDPEDIVISGIAGRFPDCDNVGELKEGLYNKKNMIIYTDERYEKGAMNAPYSSCGLLKNLDKFDAEFFRCSNTLLNRMDPAARIHMEVTYEAIADAGIDAVDLRGEKIGVFNATTQEDAFRIFTMDDSFSNLMATRTMNPNKTSHALDFKGPSLMVDTACSSSNVALWLAVNSIKEGTADAAIVSGCQLNLKPAVLMGYIKAGIATPTGNSKPFDATSDGMLRTESVCALFLQKAKVARRAYATIKSIKFYSSGFTPEGISVPSELMKNRSMREVLQEGNVEASEIDYVETHGTGTIVGDPLEVKTLAEIFCENRKKPLLIGTIKSNIGHTEACSGICGVIKSILTFESDMIPPNVNFDVPNPHAKALLEGKVVVVTEPTPFKADYIPVSALGFAGTHVETLLKKNPITFHGKETLVPLPRLILFPATTEEAITPVFEYIQNTPDLTEEFFALMHKLSFTDPNFKPFRGYALYQNGQNPVTQIKNLPPKKRQVWFIMTGLGCQWPGMGLDLMSIDVFAKSMQNSAETLKHYGIDLFEFLRPDKDYFHIDRIVSPSFASVCAVQIALVDVLKYLGVEPDGMVGHSTGEIVCAYADGCLTAEQAILSAYFRGKSVESADLAEGRMAAVGVSWSQAEQLCPEGIYPVCHNADDSVTISGLKEPMEKFVEKLKQDNIFVRMVNSHCFSFHCKHIHAAAPALKTCMEKFITHPKPRSERWISSSYPDAEWSNPGSKSASAEYFVHNLMSSVHFNEALKKIPADAITIEIGPHFLLQSILKRAIGPMASNIGLMERNNKNNTKFFMESLGKLYTEGVNPKIERLYPPVKFPVPRGTPMISDLIKWNHSQTFFVPKHTTRASEFSREFKFDKDDAYILDHRFDGKSLFPLAGYIFLAWEALAAKLQKNTQDMPVVIENLKIHREVIITPQVSTKFSVSILDSSGRFEIIEGNSLVSSGYVYERSKITFQESEPEYKCHDSCVVPGKDVYDELKRSGYEYGPTFQGLIEATFDGSTGLVHWENRWISYLDSLVVFFGLLLNDKRFCLPAGVTSVSIDPNALQNYLRSCEASNKNKENAAVRGLPVKYDEKTDTCRSIGVEMFHLKWDLASCRAREVTPTLEEYNFIPYISKYAPGHNSSHQYLQYFCECNELMNKIGKALRKDLRQFLFQVDSKDKSVSSNESDNQSLLKVLKVASENSDTLKNNAKEIFLSYARSMGKDILNNALVNEDSLRIMLDIILENSFKRLSVVEINNNFPVILLPAVQIMQKYSHSKFKRSILIAPKTIVTDQEMLDDHRIQVLTGESLKDIVKEKSEDLAIGSFMSGPKSDLQSLLRTLTSALKSNGFILLFFKERANPAELFLSAACGESLQISSQSDIEDMLKSENLLVLSKISDPFGVALYLLRSPCLLTPQKVVQIRDDNYGWVETIKEELYQKSSGQVWLVSEDGPVNGIVGMVNCLKQEPEGERIRCVFISKRKQENTIPPFSLDNPFYHQIVTKNLVMNVWKNGCWGSFRHTLIKDPKSPRSMEHSYVHCRKYGDISSLEWIQSNVNYVEPKKRKLLHIYYSALNFKDVMLAAGKLSRGLTKRFELESSVLGIEFSGKEERSGKRYCGFSLGQGMATTIWAQPECCIEIPDKWTLEEAATVPVVYATCYYSLIMRAQLKPGESILIHSGSGGIGTAAISIALSMNCEVFTTVGNDEKRKYIRERFPQIKDENIGCSRNTSFKAMILKCTNGRGVDVILNSLADDKFQANFQCIAKSGRLIEIGKCDLAVDREVGLSVFLGNISFHTVALEQLFDKEITSLETIKDIMALVKDGIKSGVVHPLDRTIFGRNAIKEAFKYMAEGDHVGKVLIKIRDEEKEKSAPPKTLILPAVPETQFYENKIYIIIGGLGGFGMEVTNWIIERGGRNIIITSRYGARTPYHFFCLERWRRAGINVQVSTLNVGIKSEAERLLQGASGIAPVGGIFNSSAVLKDAFMDVQTIEDFKEVCMPKTEATKFLDELTRKLCPSLDYFVCFSSISCGKGNAGQTNYGYANSVMERICEERRNAGLHGLAIQWGIIGEVGLVHRHMGDDAMIVGVVAQSVKSCLEALDAFCRQDCPVVSTHVTAEQTKKNIQGDLMARILNILGVQDISQITTTRRLGEMGIDSIVGIELKQTIEYYSDVNVSMQEIQEMCIDDIKTLLEKADMEKISQSPALMITTNIKLPTVLVHKEPLVILNKDGSGEPVFIVHMGDTDVMKFQTLARAINRPAYALVWTKDLPSTDLESLSSWYLKLIQDTTNNSPFHLMGHGQGGCIAFEMALQSERTHKKLKTISLLSGYEEIIKTLTTDSMNKDPEVTALCGFVEQFVSSDVVRLRDELQNMSGLEQRVRAVISYIRLSSSQTLNKNEVSEAISNYLEKQKLIESYVPSTNLSMDINLLEDPTQFLASDVVIIEEVFSQFCSGKISIHRVFSLRLLSTEEGLKDVSTVLQSII